MNVRQVVIEPFSRQSASGGILKVQFSGRGTPLTFSFRPTHVVFAGSSRSAVGQRGDGAEFHLHTWLFCPG